MRLIPICCGLQFLPGVLLLLAGMSAPLQAQRDDIVVGDKAVPQDDVPGRFQAAQERLRLHEAAIQARLHLAPQNVDQWALGGRTEDYAARQLEAALRERIEAFVKHAAVTDEQRQKLELAGWIDIQRFLERVDQLKRQMREAKDVDSIKLLQVKGLALNVVYRAGLLGDESFFAKTARTLLSSEQLAQAERGRLAVQHRAHLERAVALLKDAVKMTDQQEQALLALLLAETRPPRQPGANTYAVALFDMKRLPETKLKPLFDENQWELFNRQFEQLKWMGPYLKQNGFLHETEPAASINR